jgi:carboxypeptidase Taq
MREKFEILKERLAEIKDLQSLSALAGWDQEVYMPEKAGDGRACALAAIDKAVQEKLTSPETGALLDDCADWAAAQDPDSDEAALLRVVRRDYERAKKLPVEFIMERSKASSEAINVWTRARAANDYAQYLPCLEKAVSLARREADYVGYRDNRYDALLDVYEPGMTKAVLDKTFAGLREGLLPIYKSILARKDAVSDDMLKAGCDESGQMVFVDEIVKAMGFDFSRGRQDKSAHPFTTTFGMNDVRITTRTDKNWLPGALYSSMHECGHALYEQGYPPSFARTQLADGASMGVHESQSRLWENIIGKSLPFCRWLLPRMQKHFPGAFDGMTPEQLYRAVNRVAPSHIRTESDEVTYNLHIILRYDIETALLSGMIKTKDAPALWNELAEKYIGIRPDTFSDGILQDIHWAMGYIGYFPTYALGNLMSAQFYAQASSDMPALAGNLESGDFAPLLGWLREHVHRHGRKYTSPQLLRRATGAELSHGPFVNYLRDKYSQIYGF